MYFFGSGVINTWKNASAVFIFLLWFSSAGIQAQEHTRENLVNHFYTSGSQKFNFRFTCAVYFILNGGSGFSLSAGSWIEARGGYQPSLNSSLNLFYSGNNLGNANFYGEQEIKGVNPNKWLVNMVFSPLLTKRLYPSTNHYDEINPFYFGTSSVIFNNYRNALTIGASFVTMPRGTYNNISTARNRTQQLLFMQVKFNRFQFNIYEDYLIFTSLGAFQWLCDNRDRYYTGGGNIQVQVHPFYKLKIYSEMYTGNSYVDKQDYPDYAYPDEKPDLQRKKRNIHRKYAYQDPGQQSFNKARNFLCLEVNAGAMSAYHGFPDLLRYPRYNNITQILLGRQGGSLNMLQQNFIHNGNPINRDNKDRTRASSLHHFDYRDNFFPKTIAGISHFTSY